MRKNKSEEGSSGKEKNGIKSSDKYAYSDNH